MFPRIVLKIAVMAGAVIAAQPIEPSDQPIYRVTVVERTTKAINYRYRAEPTLIDLRGTVLLPKAKGKAVVASKPGRTEIEATFEHLTPPTPFGGEYLTYVLWALTPDGRPHNLGEILANSADKSRTRVSTDLQAFALIVTAEPYSAVRRPSDVVVMENELSPKTEGMIEQVSARYELLPRGAYTLHLGQTRASANAPKVSMREYEMLLELYQAENAVNIARAARADQYAPEVLGKAELLLNEARQLHEHKGDHTIAMQEAREACQRAEDARIIAEERSKAESAKQVQANAGAAVDRARAEAAAARADAQREQLEAQAKLEAERAARQRAEAEAQTERSRAIAAQRELESAQQTRVLARAPQPRGQEQSQFRALLLRELSATDLTIEDTPRGLVVVLPDSQFSGADLRGDCAVKTMKLSRTLTQHHDLRVEVEGHADAPDGERLAYLRAERVAASLRGSGLPVVARDIGDRRPVGPNHSAQGRLENRRVEVVISGDSIGTLPLWDRTYSLSAR